MIPLPNASLTLTCTAGAIATPATTLLGPTANVSALAAAGETVNAALVTVGSRPLAAVNCLLPTRFTLAAENVARPAASLATAPPPDSVPVPTRLMEMSWPGTALPNASFTLTCTAGAIATPATTLLGPEANVSALAAAGETVNAVLVTLGSTPLAAVSCLLPTRFTLAPANVARPAALVTTAPPPVSVPVPTSTSDTDCPAIPLPNASLTLTCTLGAIATPAATLLGPTANVSALAAAGETANAALVTVGSTPLAATSCLLPARFTFNAENVARPVVSLATAPPPVSVPVPSRLKEMDCPGTTLPNASLTLT